MKTDDKKLLKGRIAEAIVESMFEKMGWKVYRSGAEFTAANAILDRDKPLSGIAAKRIRNMPDFIVQKDRDVFLIEVKYRKEGQESITKKYIEEWKEPLYPEAYVIMVSPNNGILMEKAKDIYETKRFFTLTSFRGFDFDREIIVEHYFLAKRIFTAIENKEKGA
ncbi:MAG: hypothetical protein V1492_04030 [Candidatus Micrarchaeota archaeon]